MTAEQTSSSRRQTGEMRRRPGFFRRLGRSNRLFPRKLKINREGKYLIMLTLGIGFAAINTGYNLMYLILGMLLSMITVSGILSELSLRGIEVFRVYGESLSAEGECLLRIRIRNNKRFFVSYSIEVEEVLDYEGVDQVCSYTLRLSPQEECDAFIRARFNRRGLYESAGLSIATRFPFSLFRKSRHVVEPIQLLIYPPIREVDELILVSQQEGTDQSRPKVGRGGELYGVREFGHGDAVRDIHWKVSARRGRWVVREFEQPAIRSVLLAFANHSGDQVDAFEDAIVHVASVAARLIQKGCRVGLVTLDGSVPHDMGPRHRDRMLGHLARLSDAPAERGQPIAFDFPDESRGAELVLVRFASQEVNVANTFDQVIALGEDAHVV